MAKTRRTRGSGSYDKVDDGKGKALYRWRIGIFNPLDGKTHYKSIKAKSREALDEKVDAWKAENFDSCGNLPPLPKRLTVEKWVEIWLQTIKGKLTDGTIYAYTCTANNYIIPNFGKKWVGQLSPLDLQRFFDGLLNDVSANTVMHIRAHFRTCFELAVKLGVISRNPVKQTLPPKMKKIDLKILDEKDVTRLLEVAKSGDYLKSPKNDADVFQRKRNYLMVLLAVSSGMRLGEILGLTWPCVDVSKARIEVRHSFQDLPKNRALKSPKNGKNRIIVVPDSVAKEIAEWREFQANYAEKYKGLYMNPLNLVFSNLHGGFIGETYFGIWDYRAIRKAAGLEGTRFHDLRHFFASSALSRGVSVMAVSEQLGHSSINITLDRYTHVLERSRDEMKAMLNANPLFKTGDTVDKEPLEKNG